MNCLHFCYKRHFPDILMSASSLVGPYVDFSSEPRSSLQRAWRGFSSFLNGDKNDGLISASFVPELTQ